MTLRDAITLARPSHWIKNIIVLLPVIFAMKMTDLQAWSRAAVAAAAVCLVSSGIYIINDIRDRDRDRLHPAKKNRPLAASRYGVGAALIEAIVFVVAGMLLAYSQAMMLVYIMAAYVLLQLAYTFVLKQRIIIDVICIALGFVLRAVLGAVAIRVEISPWLIICTFTICLFLGFCKRCNEIATLGKAGRAEGHRSTLGGYTSELLTHLITLSAAIAIVSFLLYATSERTVGNLGTIYLIYTLPVVVYGVFRFAMLSMRGRFADPMDIVLRDWPLQLTAGVWIAAVVVIIRWSDAIQSYLQSL